MRIDADACYQALRSRDRRFDGVFFVAVKTTGIYCRPICPARVAARDRCEFFAVQAEAERAGYRACFRCRPELAPGHASVDVVSATVRRAVAHIDEGCLNDQSVDDLAARLGVSSRHLRRSMEAELGISPVELAQTRRLALAKQLLHDTDLSLTDIALASGFGSIRRFNAAFLDRFQRPPSSVRRGLPAPAPAGGIRVRLDYRPPYAWDAMLSFLALRSIPGVESVESESWRRVVSMGDRQGTVHVSAREGHLEALVSISLAGRLTEVVSRLRHLLDLDARPDLIDETLGRDPVLLASVKRDPGLRVPGAFDPFELAVRAVLGQRISVRAATTVAGRLVAKFGAPVDSGHPGLTRAFPSPEALARAPVDEVRSVGLPAARAQTLIELAQATLHGALALHRTADPEETMARLQQVPGIGPWTAQYITMRALRWPDAFPAGDLVVCKVLGVSSAKAAEARAEAWRPWRAYAVLHLWRSA